jgi:hypothetical protein
MKRLFIITFLFYSSCWAMKGLEKLPICATCHGMNGQSTQEIYPNLSNQSSEYMIKQLLDFKYNRRISPLMQAYASLLSDQEISELSKYYSKQQQKASQATKSTNKKGEQLYKIGNFKKKMPACIACHGPEGHGNDPAKYPNISHQHASYLMLQLEAFKKHQRTNDPHQIMQDISKKMHKSEMQDIIEYLQTLR